MKTIRARVTAVHRDLVHLHTSDAEVVASISDAIYRSSASQHNSLILPGVGDLVIADEVSKSHYRITQIEPRTSTLARRAAGSAHTAQLLAANVDTAFIFSAFPEPPNVRRLARLVSIAIAGNVSPVIVLSRADLAAQDDVRQSMGEVTAYLHDIPVVATSSISDSGLSTISTWLWPGATVVLLGPSGAGKSTMLNALAKANLMQTGATRRDGAGRHTTTHRELVELPSGLFVIDTPGLREVGVWASADVSNTLFSDIASLATQCRFSDCTHQREPGCAVRAAIHDGRVASERLEQWEELRREADFLELSQTERKRRERRGSLAMRQVMRHKHR